MNMTKQFKTTRKVGIKKSFHRISPFYAVMFFILLLLCLSLIIPFCWGLLTSFKDPLDYTANVLAFPKTWKFSNYSESLKNLTAKVRWGSGSVTFNLLTMVIFSLIYAVGGAVIQAVCCALVAYAVAKFSHFRISKILYVIVIVTMILPIVGAVPSEVKMLKALGLYNTPGVLILKANFLGTYFLVFHAFFCGIPKDFFEAAEIDGAGNGTILFRIVVPMAKSVLFTVIVLNFLGNWNDYNITLVYAPSFPTLAYGLYVFNNSNNPIIADTPHKMAGAFVVFIPVFVFFCIFSDKLLGENLTLGGVKE